MRTAAGSTSSSSFGSRLRRLAGSLSATAQVTAINEYVVRFFSATTPSERSQMLAALQQEQALQRKAAAVAAGGGGAAAASRRTRTPPASGHRKSPTSTGHHNNHHHPHGGNGGTTSPALLLADQDESSIDVSGIDVGRSGAPDRRYPDERDDLTPTEDPPQLRRTQPQERKSESPVDTAPARTAAPPRAADTRTLADVFDELVGQQLAGQPDEDVITIVVRNDDAGRRLFQYLVTGEMWFLPLTAVDADSLTDADWSEVRGAKLAIDTLVRGVPTDVQLCLNSKSDLTVCRMPHWRRGVGATLESMRQSLREAQTRFERQWKGDSESDSSAANRRALNSLMLVPTSEEAFAGRPDLGDVLAVPFEPNGMRLAMPRGQQQEISSLTLHALSDKRQAVDPIDPNVGDIVANRFLIDQKVGSATFSDAFAVSLVNAEQQPPDHHHQEVACIKVIKPEFFDQSLDEVRLLNAINELAEARFAHAMRLLNEWQQKMAELPDTDEARNGVSVPPDVQEAARLSHYHCGADAFHVVRLTDAFYFRHRMFVVTELLKENLYETTCATLAAEQEGTEPYWFNISRLAIIAKQVTGALELVHSLGLIHTDLKPENIMVQSHSRCRVKLIDFGSSTYLHERFSSYVQSRSYRAPEVVMGAPYDTRADVWSLGAVLIELAARGEILFRSTTLSNMMARVAAVCGPLPPALAHAASHADCLATRSGVFFAQFAEADDERFERLEQHPYFHTAQSIVHRADGMRVAIEEGFAKPGDGSAPASERGDTAAAQDADEKSEVWLHFPVYNTAKKRASSSSSSSSSRNATGGAGADADDDAAAVQNRQALWQRVRHGGTIADWMDIYEPTGRIEVLLERHGGWELAVVLGDERNWSQPVLPELLFLDFAKKCLIVDPNLRPTSAQLLTHPFLAAFAANEEDALLQQFALIDQQQTFEQSPEGDSGGAGGEQGDNSGNNDSNKSTEDDDGF